MCRNISNLPIAEYGVSHKKLNSTGTIVLGACHRLALREGQKENKKEFTKNGGINIKKMQTIAVLIVLGMLLSILIVPLTQIVTAEVSSEETMQLSSVEANLFKQVSLSTSSIHATWPNLPTAQMLWNSTSKFYVNTAEIGQPDPSAPAPSLSSGHINSWQFENCTVDLPNIITGSIVTNTPIIWLQYNSTIWIQVPITLLTSSNQTVASTVTAASWAIGLCTNPASIAGSNAVTGAFSYGEYSLYGGSEYGTGGYLWSDILTVFDGTYLWQLGMLTTYTSGMEVEVTEYTAAGSLVQWWPETVIASYDTMYGICTYYNPSSQEWEFYWNSEYVGPAISDGKTSIETGNQPAVCEESNDMNSGDFTYTNNYIGLNSGGYFNAAIGYQWGGNWYPTSAGTDVPQATCYYGGNESGVIFWVGTEGPQSSWPYGEEEANVESLYLGYGVSVPGSGSQLWPAA